MIDEHLEEPSPSSATFTELTLEDFDRILDELAAGSENIPALPSDFSRADIYEDHD